MWLRLAIDHNMYGITQLLVALGKTGGDIIKGVGVGNHLPPLTSPCSTMLTPR